MAEYRQMLLDASTTSLLFGTPRIQTVGLDEVFLEVMVRCTAINLITDFTIGTANTLQSGRVVNIGTGGTTGVQICTNQTGYTFSAGLQCLINNPPIGVSKFHIRVSNPGRLLGTYHTYTSGGGSVRLLVTALGWGKGTTP